MAEFGFTEAHGIFRAHARDFTRRELMPTAKERVRLNRVPGEVIKKLADTGFLGLRAPERYGGQMSDLITGGIACEETARSDVGVPYVILLSSFGAECLALCPEEVQAEWMPLLCNGERIVCLSLTEPDAGSDAAAIRARGVRDSDHYILSGEKTAITLGMQADVACTFVKSDTTAPS
jgi:cyclohexanecarboxyl-CoA dehydrogenase